MDCCSVSRSSNLSAATNAYSKFEKQNATKHGKRRNGKQQQKIHDKHMLLCVYGSISCEMHMHYVYIYVRTVHSIVFQAKLGQSLKTQRIYVLSRYYFV